MANSPQTQGGRADIHFTSLINYTEEIKQPSLLVLCKRLLLQSELGRAQSSSDPFLQRTVILCEVVFRFGPVLVPQPGIRQTPFNFG